MKRPSRLVAMVLALAMLASALAPAPEYTRQSLWQLAAYADVIATGEITRVDADTFEFRVEAGLLGTEKSTTLTVQRFEDWTCHSRWGEYKTGQRLFVFLQRGKEGLRAIGAGNEGELPFIDDEVVTENSHGYQVRGFEVGTHTIGGGTIVGTKLPVVELAAAVLEFRRLFSWTDHEVRPRRSMEDVRAFAETSRVARHMFEEVYTSNRWHGPIDETYRTLDTEKVASIGALSTNTARTWKPGDRFGASSSMMGDIDGDGIADLVVGAPWDSTTGKHHGALWLLFLDEFGAARSGFELRERLGERLPPMNEFAHFGSAAASLGDIDGNSVPDLVVSAPGWSGSRGGAWILFMERSGEIARVVEIGSSPLLSELGVGSGAKLGSSLAFLGDLDGDGSVELAVGQSPGFDVGRTSKRSVFVVSLASDGSIVRATRIHEDEFEGAFWFGSALAAIGDVNGDGVTDLAIGDDGDHDGAGVRGAVWITFLAPDGSVRGRQKISDWEGDFEGRLVDGAYFGSALAAPGDIDGDSIPDLIVGSDEGIWTIRIRREGTVKSSECLRLTGPSAGSRVRRPSLACARTSVAPVELAIGGSIGRSLGSPGTIWWLAFDAEGRLQPR